MSELSKYYGFITKHGILHKKSDESFPAVTMSEKGISKQSVAFKNQWAAHCDEGAVLARIATMPIIKQIGFAQVYRDVMARKINLQLDQIVCNELPLPPGTPTMAVQDEWMVVQLQHDEKVPVKFVEAMQSCLYFSMDAEWCSDKECNWCGVRRHQLQTVQIAGRMHNGRIFVMVQLLKLFDKRVPEMLQMTKEMLEENNKARIYGIDIEVDRYLLHEQLDGFEFPARQTEDLVGKEYQEEFRISKSIGTEKLGALFLRQKVDKNTMFNATTKLSESFTCSILRSQAEPLLPVQKTYCVLDAVVALLVGLAMKEVVQERVRNGTGQRMIQTFRLKEGVERLDSGWTKSQLENANAEWDALREEAEANNAMKKAARLEKVQKAARLEEAEAKAEANAMKKAARLEEVVAQLKKVV